MKKNTKKTLIFISVGLLTVGIVSVSIGFSIAGFARESSIPDPTTSGNLEISAAGRRKKAYFLNTNNIWSTSDSAEFWAIVWNSSFDGDWTSASGLLNFDWTKGTLSGSNYEFFVDRVKYDKIEFVRYNGSLSDPTAFANKAYNGTGVYNYTSDLTLPAENSTNFTYSISSYHSNPSDNNSPSTGTWY